jgi:hypothetical protein
MAAVMVLIVGCGGPAASPSSSIAATTSSKNQTATRSASPTSSPPRSAGPDRKSGPPSPDIIATIADPSLTLHLPPGWRTTPIGLVRDQVVQLSTSADPVTSELYTRFLADIDADAVRLFASGPSGLNPWQGTLIVEVTKAETVDAQIDAIKATALLVAPPTSSERTSIDLSIGPAERLSQTAEPRASAQGLAVAAHGIDYVVPLQDGRMLWINTTGPAASLTFTDMVDTAVATLARR